MIFYRVKNKEGHYVNDKKGGLFNTLYDAKKFVEFEEKHPSKEYLEFGPYSVVAVTLVEVETPKIEMSFM